MVSDANFFDLTDSQRKLLGQTYAKFARPDDGIVEKLVELTGLNRAIVMAWFQNERKKEKKKHLEEQKKVEKLMWQGEKKLASSDSSSFSELSYSSSSSSDGEDSSEEEEDEKRKEDEKIDQKRSGKKIVELAGASLVRDKNEEEKKKRMIEAEELAGKLHVGKNSVVQRNWQQPKNNPNWSGQDRNECQNAVGIIKNNSKQVAPMPSAPSTSSSMVEPQQNGRRAAGTHQKAKSATKMPFIDERHKMIAICKMIVACTFLIVILMTLRVMKGNGEKIIRTGQRMPISVKCQSGMGKLTPEEEEFYDLENLEITIEDTILIGPLNATHLLEEFVETKLNDGLAGGGFSWELAVRGRQAQISRSRLLIVVLRAWPKWATTGEHYMANATVKFTVTPKWSVDETILTFWSTGNSHNRHCTFSSQNGGQCGVVFPNFDKILQRTENFVGHAAADFHFYVKAAIEMKIPATAESIERL